MIIGNSSGNFGNQNNFRNNNNTNNNNMPSMPNNFENRFNKVQEYNRERTQMSNGFVKNIQEQKYSSATDTHGMQDRTLAMLHDRLEKGTISLDEFNKQCELLGKQRQNMTKNNKFFN